MRLPKRTTPLQKNNKTHNKFYKLFFKDGNQREWIVPFSIFFTVLLPVIFSVWGIKLTIDNSNNREQIDTLSRLIQASQHQVDYLQKIYAVSDSTRKSTNGLRDLPGRLASLSATLDTLNFTIGSETKKLE